MLGKVFFETFQEYKLWLQDIGATVRQNPSWEVDLFMGEEGQPYPEHCRAYFDSLVGIFEDAGGTMLLETRVLDLITDAEGTIVGLKAKGPEGTSNIGAKAVILACGGFQSNSEMRLKYLGREADLATVMGTPYNMGDGIRMAQKLGASLRGAFSTMSGSWAAAHPYKEPLTDPEVYEKAPYVAGAGSVDWLNSVSSVTVPSGAILVNLNGQRYVDEVAAYPRAHNSTLRQLQAKGIVVYDKPLYDTVAPYHDITVEECFEGIREGGGFVVIADTMSQLADDLAALPTPVHKANVLKTVAEYNAAIDAGKGAELEVARTGAATKIESPPFYAIPVTVKIYANFGGLAMNEYAQVLDSQNQPIPRLYACPPTAGGVMRSIYTGMIGCAGTFGWIAGQHAAAL